MYSIEYIKLVGIASSAGMLFTWLHGDKNFN
jgi:hypothetical protein